jgi:hypothetical protein
MYFSQVCSRFFSHRSKFSPQHPILLHPQSMFLLNGDISLTPINGTGTIIVSMQEKNDAPMRDEKFNYTLFKFLGVGWGGCVHLVHQPLFGMLYQPWMMGDDERGAVTGMIGRGNQSNSEENLHQCQSVHHKSHMTWPGFEPRPMRWEASN